VKKSKFRDQSNRKPLRPQIYELWVSDLSRAGAGVAKDDSGRVIFIPFTAPGDRVSARIINQKSKYAQAELLTVLQASAQRQEPKCPVFGRCGGCDWQHIDYPLQWQTKVSGVKESLMRTLGVVPQLLREYPARQIWSYRNRIQLHGNKDNLGYYAKSSHKIIPVERCAIAREELNDYLQSVREQAKTHNRPYKVELELLTDGSVRATWNRATGSSGFQQINSEQNQNLRQWVLENISKQQPVLDLYGGSANLSAQLASCAPHIDCVDLTDRKNNHHWPENISFHHSDVFTWVVNKANQPQRNAQPCSAIIDPPRGGMPEQLGQFIDSLQRLNVTEVIAVGCKTDTWTRDLAGFVNKGWRLEQVAVFDFFPHTPHVESAALLRR